MAKHIATSTTHRRFASNAMQTFMIDFVARAQKLACGASAVVFAFILASTNPSAYASEASAARLDFDKVFNADGAAPSMHFRAAYVSAGTTHQLEVWRDHEIRLRRRTDDAVETFVNRSANDPEWRMAVLDLRRKIRTDVDRTNLYRVGHFVDWFGMGHGLTRPSGPYELRQTAALRGVGPAIADCRWYRLSNQDKDSRICWSRAMGLPLLIATPDGQVQWRVTEADSRRATSGTFQIHDVGFARNNANADISTD